MYYYKEELINIIKPDKPDPAAAKVLQEILGGHYGEMRTMMQFFSKALISEESRNSTAICFAAFFGGDCPR
ncbi:Catalase Mn-containing [Bacillus subtilis]|nr:putative manganese catalase [Bacillus subtilis]CAI6234389.1 Catalase Mn-containing [Bacillus subtilis]